MSDIIVSDEVCIWEESLTQHCACHETVPLADGIIYVYAPENVIRDRVVARVRAGGRRPAYYRQDDTPVDLIYKVSRHLEMYHRYAATLSSRGASVLYVDSSDSVAANIAKIDVFLRVIENAKNGSISKVA